MNQEQDTIINLSKADIKAACQMLAKAFYDDPINEYAFQGVKDTDIKLPYAYEFFIRYGLKYGQVHTTSRQIEGVAVWLPSNRYIMPLWRLFISGAIFPAFRMGQAVGRRMQGFSNYIETKHRQLAPFDHWYLILLGVDPKHQGKGYAGKLLRAKFRDIDTEGLPCYVETEIQKNVSFYQHFGFRVIDEFIVPDTDVNMWVMLRGKKRNK